MNKKWMNESFKECDDDAVDIDSARHRPRPITNRSHSFFILKQQFVCAVTITVKTKYERTEHQDTNPSRHRLVPFYSDAPLFQLRWPPIVQALPSSSRLWFVFLRLQFVNIHDDTMNTVKFLLLGVLLPVSVGNNNSNSWVESLSNSVVSIIRAAVALAESLCAGASDLNWASDE